MWDIKRTTEKFVNYEVKASDLQAFLVLSQHPNWVFMLVNR